METKQLIKRNDLHTIYLVMLKRIGKGYSAEELSFLIGREPDYVPQVEMLELPVYDPEEIERIAMALGEKNLKTFYANTHLEGQFYAQITRFEEGDEIHYDAKYLDEKDEFVPSFNLFEQIGSHQKISGINDADYKMAKDALQLLKDSGYFFAAQTNQQIFDRISSFLPAGTLSPFYIREALRELSTDYHTEVLQQIMVDGMESYIEF